MYRLPSLNGLRAISITIVILYHLVRFNFHGNPELYLRFPIFDGEFGVNVFFVISGFLITSLLMQEEIDNGRISLKNFYARRTLRIFPAYFFLLFVYWLLQLAGYLYIPKMAWLTALTYTKYLNPWVDWYTAHSWSLSIEENFYLFWPLIFMLGNKTRKNMAIFLIFIVPIIRSYHYFYPLSWLNGLSIFQQIDSIAMGCFFALNRKEILFYFTPHWNKLLYLSLFILFVWPWLAALSEGGATCLIFVSLGTLHGTIADILIAIFMMYSVFGPKGRWHRALNSKLFNYIGVLSYSLYLWQQFFVYKRSWWATHFPQNVCCIFIAALFSYYAIEKPFLKLKSKFSNKKMTDPIVQKSTQILILDENKSR